MQEIFEIHPSLAYKFHPQDPQKVDTIRLGSLIAYFPKIIPGLIRNMERKLILGVSFVLFVKNTSECDVGLYTIDVIREIHPKDFS